MEYSQKSALLTQVESEAHQGCATDSTLLYSVVVNKFAWQAILSLIPGEKQIPLEMCQEENENLPNQNMRSNLLWEQSSFYVGKKSLLLIVFLVETQHWVYMGAGIGKKCK